MIYEIECTDTFGGEANYCWVRRFRVRASSWRGAARVAARHLGYSGRMRQKYSTGEMVRWNITGACICVFGHWHDTGAFRDAQHAEESTGPIVN